MARKCSRQACLSSRWTARQGCWHRHRAARACQARALLPLLEPPADGRWAHDAHRIKACPLATRAPVPRRRDSRRDRAAGCITAAGGAGSAAEDVPDALPWRVRTAQQTTRSSDAGEPGNGRNAFAIGSRYGQAAGTPGRGDASSVAIEADVWHRDRGLCPLPRQALGHPQH